MTKFKKKMKSLSQETIDGLKSKTMTVVDRLESFERDLQQIGKNNEAKIGEIADAFIVLREYTIKLADKLQGIETNLLSDKISQLSDRVDALEKSNESFLQSQRYIAKQIQQTQQTQQKSLELLQIVCRNLGIHFDDGEVG